MDVYNVFLHGDLDKEFYMKLLVGLGSFTMGKVCRLCKSLYIICLVSCNWFTKLLCVLQDYGFEFSGTNYSFFTYHQGDIFLGILVYVYDLILRDNNKTSYIRFKRHLD